MLSKTQNQALYPVLQHYTGSQIISISSENGILLFKNSWGQTGKVIENSDGDWQVIIENEIVDIIEQDVFNILIKPNKKNTLEDYLYQLNSLMNQSKLKYRSKLLIAEIIKFLEDYILTSDFLPKKFLIISPFIIFNYKGNKIINCLN